MQQLRHWAVTLVDSGDPNITLEAVTGFCLSGYDQHISVVENQQLVTAVVQRLCRCTGAAEADAAVAALRALSISSKGQKALLDAGACDALCDVVVAFGANGRSMLGHAPTKKQRLQEPPSMLMSAVQILVALLIESADRPPPGTLSPQRAEAACSTLQQVMHGQSFHSLDSAQQQAVAVVTARLGMEAPARKRQLSQHEPGQAAPGSSQQQVNTSGKGGSCDLLGLGALFGSEAAARNFLLLHWETKPHCWSLPTSLRDQAQQQDKVLEMSLNGQSIQTAEPDRQDTHADIAGDAAAASTAFASLLGDLSVDTLFDELLQPGQHCALMDFAETDPVQYLQDAYQQSQLLQPLQCNHDIRLIRTAATPADTLGAPSLTTSGTGSAGVDSCLLQAQLSMPPASQTPVAEQIVMLPEPVTAAAVQAAVADGFSLVFMGMPKRSKAVAALIDELELQMGLPAGANLYYTPPGAQGLKVHYDDHCVFVMQLCGQKGWLVAPPQHCQLPLTYTPRLPVQTPIEAEQSAQPTIWAAAKKKGQQQLQQGQHGVTQPIQCHLLLPGSCLYIPRGWVHQANTCTGSPPNQAAAAAAAAAHDWTEPATQGAAVSWSSAAINLEPAAKMIGGTPQVVSSKKQPVAVLPGAQGGSLHLSVGMEVEAWWSVQGYLHCLIQTCALRCMAQSQASNRTPDHGSSPTMRPTAAAAGAESLQGSTAASSTAAVVQSSDGGERSLRLAHAAAALLAHLLLAQHGNQHAVFRKACPVLIRDPALQQAVAAVLQQLAGYSEQLSGQQHWVDVALGHVLQSSVDCSADSNGHCLQSALQLLDPQLLPGVCLKQQQEEQQQQQAGVDKSNPTVPATDSTPGPSRQHNDAVQWPLSSATNEGSAVQHMDMHDNPMQLQADDSSSNSGLPSVLDWISRVADTASMAAGCATQRPWPDGGNRGRYDGRVMVSHSTCCPVCAAEQNETAARGCNCWLNASQVLRTFMVTRVPGTPADSAGCAGLTGAAAAAAAVQALPSAWQGLLEEIHSGYYQPDTEFIYRVQAAECLEARRLVRHAHQVLLPS